MRRFSSGSRRERKRFGAVARRGRLTPVSRAHGQSCRPAGRFSSISLSRPVLCTSTSTTSWHNEDNGLWTSLLPVRTYITKARIQHRASLRYFELHSLVAPHTSPIGLVRRRNKRGIGAGR